MEATTMEKTKKPFVYRHKNPLKNERECSKCQNPFKLTHRNRLDSICSKCKRPNAQYWKRPGIAI